MKHAPREGIVPKMFAPVKTVLKRSLQPFNKKQIVKCPLLGCLEPMSLVSTGASKGAFSTEGLDPSGLCPGAGVRGLAQTPYVSSGWRFAVLLHFREERLGQPPSGLQRADTITAGRIKTSFKGRGRLRDSSYLPHPVASVKRCSRGLIASRSRRKEGTARRDDSSLLQSQIDSVKGRRELA